MKDLIFKGVGTAIITPMNEDYSINYNVFGKLLEMQVREHADAVVVAGTAGEGSTLTDEEHIHLIEYAVKKINGRIPVIAGAGSNNTAHAVYLSEQCEKVGALCKDDLAIYSGNDDQITSALALGAKGVISVLSNIVVEDTHRMCTCFFEGDSEESDNLQLQYLELIEALFLDVNPIPIKQAMRAMGYAAGPCRLPLCDMDSTMAEKMYGVMYRYGLLDEKKKTGSVTLHRPQHSGSVLGKNI